MDTTLGRIVLLCTSLLICAGGAEVGVRILESQGYLAENKPLFPAGPFQGQIKLVPDPELRWILDPSSKLVNSNGFRDGEYSLRKPADTTRVVVLGDSVAFGFGVPLEDCFTEVLERKLNGDTHPYEVLNFSVVAYNTRQEAALYRQKARNFNPDIVLVTYVMNDAQSTETMLKFLYALGQSRKKRVKNSQNPSRLVALAQSRWSRFRSRAASGPMWAWVRQTHEDPSTWHNVEKSFELISLTASEDGAKPVLAILPLLMDTKTNPYRDIHRQVASAAQNNGFEVIDLFDVMRGHEVSSVRLTPLDLIHPNALGHRIIGNALAERIREIAQSRKPH